MIARQKDSVLHSHGLHVLTSARPSAHSWFQQIRNLCLQYKLPHPFAILQGNYSKKELCKLVKSRVVDFWECKLRQEASKLTSIPYFKPQFMSLTKPHPIWTSCGQNNFEVQKAVTTSRMLSGRYLTDLLQSHWSQNKSGTCLLPTCSPVSQGSLEHLLLDCSALACTRAKLYKLSYKVSLESDHLNNVITFILQSESRQLLMQLLIDCTVIPEVIQITQVFGTKTIISWTHRAHKL